MIMKARADTAKISASPNDAAMAFPDFPERAPADRGKAGGPPLAQGAGHEVNHGRSRGDGEYQTRQQEHRRSRRGGIVRHSLINRPTEIEVNARAYLSAHPLDARTACRNYH